METKTGFAQYLDRLERPNEIFVWPPPLPLVTRFEKKAFDMEGIEDPKKLYWDLDNSGVYFQIAISNHNWTHHILLHRLFYIKVQY